MSLHRPLIFALAFLASMAPLLGGSYPPGAASQVFDVADATTDLQDGTTLGADVPAGAPTPLVGVFSGALRLLRPDVTNVLGSFKLPDLDPNNVVRAFDAKFNFIFDNTAAALPPEGFALSFGKLPGDNGTGEDGFLPLPGGLTVAWNTRNNGEDPPSIDVLVGGVQVTNFVRTLAFSPLSHSVALHWDAAGLDITLDGKSVAADILTPGFSPHVGDRFGFSARSSDGSATLSVDNVRFTTTPIPAMDTGGVIISEFVADNSVYEDEFTGKPGWIELFNGSPEPVALDGWFLTDKSDDLKKWKIQGLVINPYNSQVVFASGRNIQASATHWPHTNFKLADAAGYLALVRPDGTTVASAYEYGPQGRNVSFGEKGAERIRGFMFPASPGILNTAEPSPGGPLPEVSFSHPGGFIAETVSVQLSVANEPGAEIRYTTNGTEPTANSTLYATPLSITGWTYVKAKAFQNGRIAGRTSSRLFVMMDTSLSSYNNSGKAFDSNLPLLYIDSNGANIDGASGGSNPFRPAYAYVFAPDPKTGRASITGTPEYAGPCGVHVRGESSSGFDQKSYAFEIQDTTGADADVSLLGMPSNSDWVLYGPWSEKTFMRNKLIFDWMIQLRGEDGMAMRTRFVEVLFNQTKPSTGKVSFTTYRGIYVLMEKLKRGSERVPLENMNDKTTDPELITGGYIIRKDKDDALKNNWTSGGGIPLQSFDPDRLNAPQFAYIKSYVSAFESALNKGDYRNPKTGYAAYIDPDTFIDAQWFLEIAKQVDGYVFSTYWHKDRAGRLRAGPLWDFNISLGNADYGTGDTPRGWLYDGSEGTGQLWYPRLHSDSNYRIAHWDRYWQMRRSFMATEQVMATINTHMVTLLDGYGGLVSNRAPSEIQNPVARHFRRWPRLGQRDWPNPPAESQIRTWQAEVAYMKNWLSNRLDWLDDQTMRSAGSAYRPPVLSHPGGLITEPIELSMAPYKVTKTGVVYGSGTVYFTADGSDPRLAGGAVNPAAQAYGAPLQIRSPLTINARLYNPANRSWSALATSTYFYEAIPASASNLVISEIGYAPAPVSTDEKAANILDPEHFEFIELRNISDLALDLTDVRFTQGIAFEFSKQPAGRRLLLPGQFTLVVANVRDFQQRHPSIPAARIAGQFHGHLGNSGESLTLTAADGSLIRRLKYTDQSPWPDVGTGEGRSLVLSAPFSNPDPADPFNWLPSAFAGGTPGSYGTGDDLFLGVAGKDTDGDGFSDLFEFATGSDPEDPHASYPPTVRSEKLEVNGSLERYLIFEHRRSATAKGVGFRIEVSTDLHNWVPSNGEMTLLTSAASENGTVLESYRTSVPVGKGTTPDLYLRLAAREE